MKNLDARARNGLIQVGCADVGLRPLVRDINAARAFSMRFVVLVALVALVSFVSFVSLVSLVSVVSICQLVHKKRRCSGDASYSRKGLLNRQLAAHRRG